MIRLIDVEGYRCLHRVRQQMESFHVLVGPNASGKSTFLDVIRLLGDVLKDGLMEAVHSRSPNLSDLIWMGQNKEFEIAVEMEIPEERRRQLPRNGYERARYEMAIGLDVKNVLSILSETLWLKPAPKEEEKKENQRELFPSLQVITTPVVLPEGKHTPSGWKKVVTKKSESGNDYFFSETTDWNNPFRLGPQRSALANLPEDENRFPVAIWVKHLLIEGIQSLTLNSQAMRRPTPPGSPQEFQPDGSNLPLVIEELRKSPERFERWIGHVRTALTDLNTVDTVERPEDKHRYLRLSYQSGLSAPSWMISDGTLRLLALTLLAYLNQAGHIYLIEEPENGIHPRAVEAVFQSLSSTYENQILCASHSPVILSLAEPEQILCFARSSGGATDIVRGSEHPMLRDWRRGIDLGTLFATGVLG